MRRTCDAEDWEHVPEHRRPLGAPCGQTYDDVDHSTLCPHAKLPPKLSLDDLEDLARREGIHVNRPDPDATPRENRPTTHLGQTSSRTRTRTDDA